MLISHSSTLHTLYTITSAPTGLRNNDCSSYTYTYANIHAYSPMHTHSLTHTYMLNTHTFTHTNLKSYFSSTPHTFLILPTPPKPHIPHLTPYTLSPKCPNSYDPKAPLPPPTSCNPTCPSRRAGGRLHAGGQPTSLPGPS